MELEHNFFKETVILVFGGTGTVGSLIVEYLLDKDVKAIRVFSNSEQELWEAKQKWTSSKLRFQLGDIRDKERVKRALKGADYAFNCAAVKHVPLAEYNPMESVNVNIHGLENIIEGCISQGVSKLLHVSTDKAVEPTCVMGNCKAIGERLLQMRWAQNPKIGMVCVRSGNIWDSRGSIMQLVRECVRLEKPIPITDPSMKRYFIEPSELLEFMIKAFKKGNQGDIWVPKLKEVSILEVIREGSPKDYPLIEIGRRKGEKLTEKLISEGETNVEEHGKYWIVKNDWRGY